MKLYRIAAIALAMLMLLSLAACKPAENNGDGTSAPVGTSNTPGTSAKDDKTSAAGTTKAPEISKTPGTTQAPETSTPETNAPFAGDQLSDAEMAILRSLMPQQLPDNSDFSIHTRLMCCDNDADYIISGNSAGSTQFVDEAGGAIYGKAVRFAGKADSKDSRGEITIDPNGEITLEGVKGIMFYVDFSHVEKSADEKAQMCASVTINTNDIRAKGSDGQNGSAVAYYYADGVWTKTTNVNACRQAIPDNFKGWIYIPATSYFQEVDGLYWDSKTGCFNEFVKVQNMRCYTDGYTYSADSYIIFDEITFIK